MRWRGSLLCLGLATVAQPCGYPIDGQMDCLHHALVGLAGACGRGRMNGWPHMFLEN